MYHKATIERTGKAVKPASGQRSMEPVLKPVRKNILTKIKETLQLKSITICYIFLRNCYLRLLANLTLLTYRSKAMVDG